MKHNTYFDGKVQSLGVNTPDGYATVGVMEPGNYTFKTDCEEHMIIVAGSMKVKMPGGDWRQVSEKGMLLFRQTFPLTSMCRPTWRISVIIKDNPGLLPGVIVTIERSFRVPCPRLRGHEARMKSQSTFLVRPLLRSSAACAGSGARPGP